MLTLRAPAPAFIDIIPWLVVLVVRDPIVMREALSCEIVKLPVKLLSEPETKVLEFILAVISAALAEKVTRDATNEIAAVIILFLNIY